MKIYTIERVQKYYSSDHPIRHLFYYHSEANRDKKWDELPFPLDDGNRKWDEKNDVLYSKGEEITED